jgi:hypothetical protein
VHLARVHYKWRLIGVDELQERCKVAEWLSTDWSHTPDPRRSELQDKRPHIAGRDRPAQAADEPQPGSEHNPPKSLHFVFMDWHFTLSDPDPYPATPYGRHLSHDRRWPRLNPYTGRVFSRKHQEDVHLRLSREEMRLLWRSERFRNFCKNHTSNYRIGQPSYDFPMPDPLKFPTW